MGGGGALVLGEMDVARVSRYRYDQDSPSTLSLVRTPSVSRGHPIPGVEVRHLPGGRRPPGPDDIGRLGDGE